jgi:hypothetical protein
MDRPNFPFVPHEIALANDFLGLRTAEYGN